MPNGKRATVSKRDEFSAIDVVADSIKMASTPAPFPLWEKACQELRILAIALWRAGIKTYTDNGIGLAKEAAYSFLLSLFPMLAALIACFFLWDNSEQNVQEVLRLLRRIFPPSAYSIVADYVRSLAISPHTNVFWFSLLGALWTASGVMCSLQRAFQVIYQLTPQRSFWKRRIVALLLVISIGIPMMLATLLTFFVDQLQIYLVRYYEHDALWQNLWVLGGWLITLSTITLMTTICYRVGNEQSPPIIQVLPGALLATFLWLILTLIFNSYVQNFGTYDRIYGSLGAVIVLLVWMFLTALALLYGAAFNFELAQLRSPSQPLPVK
jgi:membrane protein